MVHSSIKTESPDYSHYSTWESGAAPQAGAIGPCLSSPIVRKLLRSLSPPLSGKQAYSEYPSARSSCLTPTSLRFDTVPFRCAGSYRPGFPARAQERQALKDAGTGTWRLRSGPYRGSKHRGSGSGAVYKVEAYCPRPEGIASCFYTVSGLFLDAPGRPRHWATQEDTTATRLLALPEFGILLIPILAKKESKSGVVSDDPQIRVPSEREHADKPMRYVDLAGMKEKPVTG